MELQLFTREDKLIKTVVVHDGSYPVRYYMFLFPDQPTFDSNLGPPLLLSPLIRAGKIEEARQVAKVISVRNRWYLFQEQILSQKPSIAKRPGVLFWLYHSQ